MKNSLHKTKKQDISFIDYEERGKSHHISKKVKTHAQQRANNALDKALRQKNLNDLYNMDDLY